MIEDYKESMKESRTLQEYIDQPIDSVHKHVEEEVQYNAMRIHMGVIRGKILKQKAEDQVLAKEGNQKHITTAMRGS